MGESHLFPILDRQRRGLTVHRYHTHRVLRPQSVGEHSAGVALIAKALLEADGPQEPSTLYYVVQAAIEHDLAEAEAGDNPAPAKRKYPELKALLSRIEAKVNDTLGLEAGRCLHPRESAVLGIADELEFLFYTLDERRLGNVDMEALWFRGSVGLRERVALHREKGTVTEAVSHATLCLLESIATCMKDIMGGVRYFTQAAHFAREKENGK